MKLNSIIAALICSLSFIFTSCDKDENYENLYEEQNASSANFVDVENEIKISEDMYELYDIIITYKHDGITNVEQLNKKYLTGTLTMSGENHSVYLVQKYSINKCVKADKIDITVSATPKANANEILEGMSANKKVNLYCSAEGFVNSDNATYFNEEQVSAENTGINKDKMNKIFANGKIVVYNAVVK